MPAYDYDHATPDDLEPLAAILAESFAIPPADAVPFLERAGLWNVRVVRANHEVRGGCLALPFGQTVGGRALPMLGIAAVGIGVTARGQGAATALMTGVVRECAADGVPISTLYASNQPLYRRVGYEQAGTRFLGVVPAAGLPDFGRLPGRAVEVPPEDPRVRSLYEQYGVTREGALTRPDYLWRRIEHPRGAVLARGVLVEDAAGLPIGYVWFSLVKGEQPGFHAVHVADAVATGPAGWRAIWTVLRGQATMGREIRFPTAPTDPLFRTLPHPWVQMSLFENSMTRVCDTPKTLTGRGYPPGLGVSFVLDVRDDLGVAGGRFAVAVADGVASVSPTTGAADIEVDVRGLAGWVTGFLSAADLADLGYVAGTGRALAAADAAFSGPLPWMRDQF